MRFIAFMAAIASIVVPSFAHAAACDGFVDVDSANTMYCSAVSYLRDKGITLGCTGTQYCPNDPVSRLQMALFLQRMGRGGPDNVLPDATSTIGGGNYQTINSTEAYATIGGGNGNYAEAAFATVSGGHGNDAGGANSMIPGGTGNYAGGTGGFAAGTNADAGYPGQFVWADATALGFDPGTSYGWGGDGTNTFNVRAVGGVWFVTGINGTGVPTTGAYLNPGSGAWSQTSDRAQKDDVRPIEAAAILDKVGAMPLTSWRYITERGNVRHLGPMAQDFHAAFGLGPDETSITTIDEGGVALAAIQGLYEKERSDIAAKDARIAELEARIGRLEAMLPMLGIASVPHP